MLKPIRAFTKGLEDLVPKADRDVLLAELDRLRMELDRFKKTFQELQEQLDHFQQVSLQTDPVSMSLPVENIPVRWRSHSLARSLPTGSRSLSGGNDGKVPRQKVVRLDVGEGRQQES